MGAAVFALTDTLETAADLASRSGGKQELVQLLRAVEGKKKSVMTLLLMYSIGPQPNENKRSQQ